MIYCFTNSHQFFHPSFLGFQVGNQEAYEEIDNQRKTEKSYHFDVDELKIEEDAAAEEEN